MRKANNSETRSKTSDGKWIQYNVPVDVTRIYHVAYLRKTNEKVHVWENAKADHLSE